MLNVLGENYFIDLDEVEKFLDITEPTNIETSGTTELKVNVIKFEMLKMMLDVIFTENSELDEKLGTKGSNNISIPFKLAFNTLLNKKLINHY